MITTNVPPEKIVAKTTGRIEAILIGNKTTVTKNMPIAVIENSANYQDVFRLSKAIDAAENNIENFSFSAFDTAQLGEIESSFATVTFFS